MRAGFLNAGSFEIAQAAGKSLISIH